MERNQLEALARIVLPSEMLDYFEITSVEQSQTEIRIHLDELKGPALSGDAHFVSKGFMDAVDVTDPQGHTGRPPPQVDRPAHGQEFLPSGQP